LERALRIRSRHDKRAIRSLILPTVGEKEGGRTGEKGEGPEEGPRDKI
jgi:hypothetical protein